MNMMGTISAVQTELFWSRIYRPGPIQVSGRGSGVFDVFATVAAVSDERGRRMAKA